jgi:uncharacterized protein (DUF952 family)
MIYHITTHEAWERALELGSHRVPSLKTEGFIHCSEEAQLIESATKHYADHDSVVVLHIIEKRVKDILKREPSRGGQLFPHLYGPLPLEAVEDQSLLQRNANGDFEWIKTRKH